MNPLAANATLASQGSYAKIDAMSGIVSRGWCLATKKIQAHFNVVTATRVILGGTAAKPVILVIVQDYQSAIKLMENN